MGVINSPFHTTATVLPGHRIELTVPEFREGDMVQVVVTSAVPAKSTETIFDIIADLKGHRLFGSAEEIDRYINEECDSWE